MFDAQSFLDASINSSLDTKTVPVPVGEYMGIIEKVIPRQWTSKDGTQSGIAIDVLWLVEDDGVKDFLDRQQVICKQGIMLDILPTGALDTGKGKNIQLGRLREALNLNKHGEAFSFTMLPGQGARISIKHRIDGEDTFSEVKGVTAL